MAADWDIRLYRKVASAPVDWEPSALSPVLFLDGRETTVTGGDVTGWHDQSGNDFSPAQGPGDSGATLLAAGAAAGFPLGPSVAFDVTTAGLSVPSGHIMPAQGTLIVLVANVQANPYSSYPAKIIQFGTTFSGVGIVRSSAGNWQVSSDGTDLESGVATTTSPTLLTVNWTTSDTNLSINGGAAIDFSGVTPTQDTGLVLGSDNSDYIAYPNIAFVLLFDRTLTSTELSYIGGWAERIWGGVTVAGASTPVTPAGWQRAYFPSGDVQNLDWELLEAGGYGSANIELLQPWSGMSLDGTEQIDIRVGGEMVYRGDIRMPQSILDIPETRRIAATGRVNASGADWTVNARYVYATLVDLSQAAQDLFADLVSQVDSTAVADIETIGANIQPGMVFDWMDKSLSSAMSDLIALAPNEAIWGWDTAPDPGGGYRPVNRFYLRPRAAASSASRVYGVGDNVKLLASQPDYSAIVTKLRIRGGPGAQPNRIMNGSFERPTAPDEKHGNLLKDGSFDEGHVSYSHGLFGITTGATGGNYWWTALNDASFKDTDHAGGGQAAPNDGNWWVSLDQANETVQQTVAFDHTKVLRAAGSLRRGTRGRAATVSLYLDALDSGGAVLSTIGHPSNPFDPYTLPDALAETAYVRTTWDADFTGVAGAVSVQYRAVGHSGTNDNDGVFLDTCGVWYRDVAVQNGWTYSVSGPTSIENISDPSLLSTPLSPDPAITWLARYSQTGVAPLYGNYAVKVVAAPASGGYVELDGETWAKVKGEVYKTYALLVNFRTAPAGSGDPGAGGDITISCGAYAYQSDTTYWGLLEGDQFVGGADGKWHTAYVAIAVDNTEVDLQPFIRIYTSGTVYFDNVMLVEGPVPTECTEVGDFNWWEADNYEWTVDTSNPSLTLSPASLADPTTGALAKYGTRFQVIQEDRVVDRASAIALASGELSARAQPRLKCNLTVWGDETPADLSKQIELVNFPDLAEGVPSDQALIPVRILNKYNGGDGSFSFEMDLNNERPHLALLFAQERTATALANAAALKGSSGGSGSSGSGGPYNGAGGTPSGAVSAGNVVHLTGAAQQVTAPTMFKAATDTTTLAVQRLAGQTSDLVEVFDDAGVLLQRMLPDGSYEWDFPAAYAGKPIVVKVNAVEMFAIHADGTAWVRGVQIGNPLDVRLFGAKGDGATDDTAAIQAAISAASAGGGEVYFASGTYVVASPLVLDGIDGVTLQGVSVQDQQGQDGGAIIKYTGAAGPAISMRGCRGCALRGLSVTYSSTAMTGYLIDARANASGTPTAYLKFEDCSFAPFNKTDTSCPGLMIFDGAFVIAIDGCSFYGGQYAIIGILVGGYGYSNSVHISDRTTFGGHAQYAIRNPNAGWSITNCTFEPSQAGVANALTVDSGAVSQGLMISGNLFVDDLAGTGGAWINWSGTGLALIGNDIGCQTTTTVLRIAGNACSGISIHGNSVVGVAGTNKFVDFGATSGHTSFGAMENGVTGVSTLYAGTIPSGSITDSGGTPTIDSPVFTGTVTLPAPLLVPGQIQAQSVKIASTGANLLNANDSDFESSTGGWGDNDNVTLTTSTAQALHGTHSLSMAATATANWGGSPGRVSTDSTAISVSPATQYTALASVYPAVSGTTLTIGIGFYDASSVLISEPVSANFVLTAGAWEQYSLTATSPAGSVTARVFINFNPTSGFPIAAGVVNYVDQVSLAAGSSLTWEVGGGGTQTIVIDGETITASGSTDLTITPASGHSVIVEDVLVGPTTTANAASSRANLGLAIGANVQAWSAALDALAAVAGYTGSVATVALGSKIADPTAALTLALGTGGDFNNGDVVKVAYSWRTTAGFSTRLSPWASISPTGASETVTTAQPASPPAGAAFFDVWVCGASGTAINFPILYGSAAASGSAAFTIANFGTLPAAVPPYVNTTQLEGAGAGTALVFSDGLLT